MFIWAKAMNFIGLGGVLNGKRKVGVAGTVTMVVALQGRHLGASFVVELEFMASREGLSSQLRGLPLKLTLKNR